MATKVHRTHRIQLHCSLDSPQSPFFANAVHDLTEDQSVSGFMASIGGDRKVGWLQNGPAEGTVLRMTFAKAGCRFASRFIADKCERLLVV